MHATGNAMDLYGQVLRSITSGRFRPNERLVEEDLIQEFGATWRQVRATLLRLDQERLVTRLPNRGARVRVVPDIEAVEIEDVRSAIECGLVAAAVAAALTPVFTTSEPS